MAQQQLPGPGLEPRPPDSGAHALNPTAILSLTWPGEILFSRAPPTHRGSNKLSVWVCVCPVAESCLTLCGPTDCSPPGSSAPGIFQAGILEWSASSYSKGIPRIELMSLASPALASGSLPPALPGKPHRFGTHWH